MAQQPQSLSSATTVRLSFSWLLAILLAMVAFGVLGGLLAQRILPNPLPLPSDNQQLITTVQQVTVSPSKQRTAVAESVGKSVVTIMQQTGTTSKLLGLGTIVTNDGYIATPAAVLAGTKGVTDVQLAVIDSNGSVAAVQVIGTDAVYGLTYLKLASGVGVPIELVAEEALPGSSLVSVSRSLATGTPTIASFELQEYVVPPIDASLVGGTFAPAWQRLARGQYSAISSPGTPVATDEGKIAGLTISAEQGLVLRAGDLKESLDRVITGKRETDPFVTLGIAVRYDFVRSTTAANTGAPQFAAVVVGVTPNSPAALAGVKVQDAIVKIGNEPVVWSKNIAGQVPPTLPVDLTLSHIGVERTVSLTVAPATP